MTSIEQLKDMPTILVVCEYLSPSSNSTGEYFYHIISAFLEEDFKLILVAPGSDDNKKACESLKRNWGDSFEFNYSKDFSFFNTSKLKAMGWFLSTLSIWYKVSKLRKKTSLLFFGTNPTFLSVLNGLSFYFWRHKSVLLCYDIFPDNLVALTNNKYKKIIGNSLRPLFISSLKKTNKVLVIGHCMADYLVKQGVSQENIAVVSNWADGNEIFPLSNVENNNVKFQFFGNLGPLQGIEKILGACEFVKSENACFTFSGKGGVSKSIQRFIENNRSKVNVNYIGSVGRSRRNSVLNDCDVAIVSLDKRITGMGVPSKAYYSLAAGKPLLVLADAKCETSRLVNKYNLGWVVPSNSCEDIAHVIDRICLNPSAMPSTQHVREIFEKHFDRKIGTGRILNAVLDEVAK